MRHSAITFAGHLEDWPIEGDSPPFDLVFATSMVNMAELVGLAPRWVRDLPRAVYFHENQLTYPDRQARDRDAHFGYSQFASCISSNLILFNSCHNRDSFFTALRLLLGRMPDFHHLDRVDQIEQRSSIVPPGINPIRPTSVQSDQADATPLRILWSARWEHDKNPETFFEALGRLRHQYELPFEVIVLGEQFRKSPTIFTEAHEHFREHIVQWGFAENRSDYERLVASADVVVSTAKHEFFGLAIVEAISAGVMPMVPKALAYPEVLNRISSLAQESANTSELSIDPSSFFHENTEETLAQRLAELAQRKIDTGSVWPCQSHSKSMGAACAKCYDWSSVIPELDAQLESLSAPQRTKPHMIPAELL